MPDIEIWVGPSKIFAAGTVVLDSATSIALYPFRPNTNYKIEINFLSNTEAPLSTINWSIVPPETFIINAANFNSPVGISTYGTNIRRKSSKAESNAGVC
jgi:hypothetical protein